MIYSLDGSKKGRIFIGSLRLPFERGLFLGLKLSDPKQCQLFVYFYFCQTTRSQTYDGFTCARKSETDVSIF